MLRSGFLCFVDFLHRQEFQGTQKSTALWKLDQFPSSNEGVETCNLLGALERAIVGHGTLPLSNGPETAFVTHPLT
jgi:hypothetical protein